MNVYHQQQKKKEVITVLDFSNITGCTASVLFDQNITCIISSFLTFKEIANAKNANKMLDTAILYYRLSTNKLASIPMYDIINGERFVVSWQHKVKYWE